MSKYCKECGNSVNEKAVTCPACGCLIGENMQYQSQQPIYVKQITAPFSGMAITGFVLSLLSLIPGFIFTINLPHYNVSTFDICILFVIVSFIFSTLGLRKTRYEERRGKGLAITGNIISGLHALWLMFVFWGLMIW